jgi:hypothetical protein
MKDIYAHMKKYVWYVRPSGNSYQYGLLTDRPGMHFSIYLSHPGTGNQEVSNANFVHKLYDSYATEGSLFKKTDKKVANYLTHLLSNKRGHNIVKEIFEERG